MCLIIFCDDALHRDRIDALTFGDCGCRGLSNRVADLDISLFDLSLDTQQALVSRDTHVEAGISLQEVRHLEIRNARPTDAFGLGACHRPVKLRQELLVTDIPFIEDAIDPKRRGT